MTHTQDDECEARVRRDVEGMREWAGDVMDDTVFLLRRLDEARQDIIPFCAIYAETYARERGLPDGHLHPAHYDILARAGARMEAFTRSVERWGISGEYAGDPQNVSHSPFPW